MAGVPQTQYCRIDEGSRCVVAMTVEMTATDLLEIDYLLLYESSKDRTVKM